MSIPNPKELKKLVKACREAGIKQFKGNGYEFTLTDEAPVKRSNARKNNVITNVEPADSSFESDTLTEDALLMWSSAGGGVPFSGEQEDAN